MQLPCSWHDDPTNQEGAVKCVKRLTAPSRASRLLLLAHVEQERLAAIRIAGT